jgi:stage V sporulation protein G
MTARDWHRIHGTALVIYHFYVNDMTTKTKGIIMNYQAMKKADLIAHILKLESQTNSAMQVTDCNVFPFHEGPSLGNVKAIASVIFNDQFMLRGLRVMNGENGLFVSYPIDPFFKGEDFRTLCNPITRALREHIENAVLEKYQQAVETSETTNG